MTTTPAVDDKLPTMTRRRVLSFGVLTATLASGYGVMFTVLDNFRDDYGISETWLGVIVGIGFFSSFLAQIFIAPIADRGQARRVLISGILIALVGVLGMAFGTTLETLLAARFVMGVGIGAAFPAVRRIVISGDPANLGNNLGLLISADVTGFALGPAISAVLVPFFGLSAPFLFIAAATVCALPLALSVHVDEGAVAEEGAKRLAFDLFKNRAFTAAACMGAAVFLMIGAFDALWAVVLDDLGAGEVIANVGITFFAMPLIFLGSFGGRVAQRLGPFRIGTVGILIGAFFVSMYGLMPTGATMLAVGLVHATFDGVTIASTGVATGSVVEAERQASAQGMVGAVETMTAAVTAVAAGAIYEHFGRVAAYSSASAVMVILAAAGWTLAGPEWRSAPNQG